MGDHGQARLAADLHDGVHMPVRAHPVGMGGADGADAGGAPLQLPALQSQRDGIAIGIAGDELQPHAREVAQEDHGGVVGRAGGGAAHLQLRTIGPHEVGEGFGARVPPRPQHEGVVGVAGEGAQKHHVAGAVFDGGIAPQHGGDRRLPIQRASDRAIARGHALDILGGAQGSRARHVLDDDGGIARDEIAEMAGEQAGVEVIPAAGAISHDDLNLLAPIEIGDFVSPRRPCERQANHRAKRVQKPHMGLPLAHHGAGAGRGQTMPTRARPLPCHICRSIQIHALKKSDQGGRSTAAHRMPASSSCSSSCLQRPIVRR